jgi:putative transposase
MSKNRRTFTAAEKLAIINEAEQFGITQTLRKHNLSHSVFRKWRDQFNEGGISRLKSYARERNPELDEAKEQLRLLKNVVARLQMELEFKDELLKKLNPCPGCDRGCAGIRKDPSSEYANLIGLIRTGIQQLLLQAFQ